MSHKREASDTSDAPLSRRQRTEVEEVTYVVNEADALVTIREATYGGDGVDLCAAPVPHICQQETWDCGYASLSMLFVALAVRNRDFAEVLCAAGVVVGAAGGYAPASVGAIQWALEAAWAAGVDPEGRRKIVSKSETPFPERRDPDAAVGGCEGCAILEHAKLPATIISYKKAGAAKKLLADVATHFQTPGRSPGVLTCGHHVRLVVGAVNSPYEPPHIILLDPNWREPKYEPRDQEWLERQDTTFELLLPVAVTRSR